ncbi:MAG: hypothetical protein AAFO74_03420 [Pseudomonadota bacterium]
MSTNDQIYFCDKRFTVTSADIKTATVIYPVSDATARIRRDIFYGAVAYSALAFTAALTYHDLLFMHEKLILGASIIAALIAGLSLSILQIDARFHPSRLWIGRRRSIKSVFDAMTKARADTHRIGSHTSVGNLLDEEKTS